MENTYYKKSIWKWVIIYLIIAVVAYAAIYYFFFYNKGGSSLYQNLSGQNQTGLYGATATSDANTVNITIANMAFSPANVTIKKGTTVIWTNNDSVTHTVTADKDGPMSPDLHKGASYSDTFTTTGTYAYHCSVHPAMKGVITVTE